ncbi:aldehyde dehydrogenase family protein [Reichenbachiella carrageenanivorans]|uniref:Aldehyde dehydrogenase family protein n=1 Tax=Reichenbachiella carrageenanivorans TaxID=2979869 RepID=A0ABY6CWP2_9BACT|nr:aldehyde dehydrogenase family protein [Reichenbachiella carrageenanivorans]UXX78293.1 aldehyde dehydrogenase family protein [Reichenbachiella carrageenanivorans]
MSTLKIFAPFDQSLIKEIPLADSQQMQTAIDQAHELFLDPSQWLPKYKRVEILEKIAILMAERSEEIIRTSTQEGGKPWMDTEVEMTRAINGVKLAIENMGHLKGEEVAMGHTASSANRMAYTMREPIGVVASVSAFNHPINLIIHQTIPAIAVGSPVIIKPAPTTPLTCLLLVELFEAAGLPKGWCTAMPCNNDVAELLVTSPKVNFFSFIGSAKVGWYLRSKLAPGTRCALEHGGAAPVIIEPDADLSSMIPALVKGGFYHAGQVCVSVQRIYVHESITDQVIEEMESQVESLKSGDPLNKDTEVGPLILPKEVDRVHEWVEEAKANGATIICGGKKISDTFYAPTLLLNPSEDSKVSSQEIFGPVVCLYTYSNRDQAIAKANSLAYAFQASIFTKNIDIALDTVKKLNATAVMVNDHTAFRVDWMPFGGRDASGLGLGSIPHSMHDMTREKLMVIKSSIL